MNQRPVGRVVVGGLLFGVCAMSACAGSDRPARSEVAKGARRILDTYAWLPVPATRPEYLTAIQPVERGAGLVEITFVQADLDVLLCAAQPGVSGPHTSCDEHRAAMIRSTTVQGTSVVIVFLEAAGPAADKEQDRHLSEPERAGVRRFWEYSPFERTPTWLKTAIGQR